MVIPLGPGKFYGRMLPRPRFYADVKFNDERIDPPPPVMDPLMSWANEAHWSMGGLSFRRLRLQGRIEGNVSKLRAEREKLTKKKKNNNIISSNGSDLSRSGGKIDEGNQRGTSVSPPPAPVAAKKRRYMSLIDEEEEEQDRTEIESRLVSRRLVKKLGDYFDMVASENEKGDGSDSTNSKKRSPLKVSGSSNGGFELMEPRGQTLKTEVNQGGGLRTSPRLAKRKSS